MTVLRKVQLQPRLTTVVALCYATLQLVASSSYSVYGKPTTYPVQESAACQPNTVQGHAALFTESAVRTYAAAEAPFKAAILRHAGIMGADPQARLGSFAWPTTEPSIQYPTDPLTACLSAATKGLQEQPYKLFTSSKSTQLDGQDIPCFREYIHVSDLAAAYVAAISKVDNPPSVYNAGTGQPVTYKEVMEVCQRILGVTLQVTSEEPSDDLCYGVMADISKLQADTGWRPQYQLDDSLRHALAGRSQA
eukprot:GHUV01018446.1.p1 GENE.GHUV01018446.1~~GHUV01018446.1.p1  ORF type:complete len:250 (+),score=61.65 GHUV01018446.1:188-937(+)